MVRPRVARGFFDPADTVLHQCIRPLLGARCAPGHHGYQRACGLISRQASTGPFGSPVFACAGKTDLHHRLILSQTSAGKLIMSSVAPHFCAVPLFVPGGRSFVPTWRVQARRAQGAVKAGRRAGLASRFRAARPRLDGPEHGARITLDGTPSHWSCRTRRRAPC